jgi:hypothetical protein
MPPKGGRGDFFAPFKDGFAESPRAMALALEQYFGRWKVRSGGGPIRIFDSSHKLVAACMAHHPETLRAPNEASMIRNAIHGRDLLLRVTANAR